MCAGNKTTPSSLLVSIPEDLQYSLQQYETTLQTQVKLEENKEISYLMRLKQGFIILYHKSKHQDTPLAFIHLDFSLKLSKIEGNSGVNKMVHNRDNLDLKGIRLQNQKGQKVQFFIDIPAVALAWVKQLSKYVYQLNFYLLFKPIRKLGKGSSASVFEFIRIEDRQKFAVKIFSKKEIKSSLKKFDSFRKQVEILCDLNDQKLLKFQGVYESDKTYELVMELFNGGNLLEFLMQKKEALKISQIRKLMRSIIKNLVQLQNLDLVHRDIKLDNIALRDKDCFQIGIIDYGLAVYAEQDDYIYYNCGTPGYISPQILKDGKKNKITTKSDIFSVGAILHVLLTGRYLFNGKDASEVFSKNKSLKIDLTCIKHGVDKSALDLLQKMLTIQPQNRLSASECLEHQFLKMEISIQQ